MKAVIMAGGQGSRLRPLTVARPKPLLPLVNKPVIAHIIDWLKRHQIVDIVVTLQHQAEWFQGYLGSGTALGVNLQFAVEEIPLGTAGGVANAIAMGYVGAEETFLVVSGDAVTDISLHALIDYQQAQDADVVVALYRMASPTDYGMVITEGDGRISQFVEKPGWADVVSDVVNTGIYVMKASVLANIPPDTVVDFSHDLFPQLLATGKKMYGLATEGYWTDVGTPMAYAQANMDVLLNRVQHEPLGQYIGGDIWAADNVDIAPDARLFGPIYLGNNVQIKGAVVIQGPAVIRDDTVVDNRSVISHSVVWRGCYIGEDVHINGAVISKQCVIKPKAQIQEGAVLGDRCLIGPDAVIYPNVKLWPGKEIESGAEIRHSIIWGSLGRRVLFGRFGVTGVVNVDLTPEFAAKLGVAFGASLEKGSIVTINRDIHPSSRMLKRAIISGLPAAGINVLDLRSLPIPLARYFTRTSDAVAGVHVRISPYDRRVVDIRLINQDGLNLGRAKEREVERLFFREDFRRAQLDDIGTISYAQDVETIYGDRFLSLLDTESIRQAKFTMAVDYAHATTVDVLEPLLARLAVDVVGLNTRPEPRLLSVLRTDWERGMQLLTRLVQAMELDLGARIDVSGEKVFFVDGNGQRVTDQLAAAMMAELVWRDIPDAVIAVPLDQPNIFERLADKYRGEVIRTKVDVHDLMTTVIEHDVKLAVDGNGYFIFPELLPVADGMFALARLLQYLAKHQTTLHEVVSNLPTYAWQHETVACPWDAKGRVMRWLNEAMEANIISTIDGCKFAIDTEQWVHIRSDPDYALLHICVEATNPDQAQALATSQIQRLQGLIQQT